MSRWTGGRLLDLLSIGLWALWWLAASAMVAALAGWLLLRAWRARRRQARLERERWTRLAQWQRDQAFDTQRLERRR